jgi:hypothetical protein
MRRRRDDFFLMDGLVGFSHLTAIPLRAIIEREARTTQEEDAMAAVTRTTDDKARISLPGSFANSTVLVEQVSDTEIRIRKARVIPEDELPFLEESLPPLSDRDRDIFLALLDNPPSPNEALKRLMDQGRRQATRQADPEGEIPKQPPQRKGAKIRGEVKLALLGGNPSEEASVRKVLRILCDEAQKNPGKPVDLRTEGVARGLTENAVENAVYRLQRLVRIRDGAGVAKDGRVSLDSVIEEIPACTEGPVKTVVNACLPTDIGRHIIDGEIVLPVMRRVPEAE